LLTSHIVAAPLDDSAGLALAAPPMQILPSKLNQRDPSIASSGNECLIVFSDSFG
jgi:hypothetical protein